VIFAFGITYLGALIGYEKAWALGVAPFYLATLFKTLLAAACMKAGWSIANFRG
jgi:biotin transport system substrate-specific component